MIKKKTKIVKYTCPKGGEIYEEEIEPDETDVKFRCAIHHCRLYKVKENGKTRI
jgi:hypothetical protein